MDDTLSGPTYGEPVLKILRRHIFEVLALFITIIGILGYSSGMSYLQGWYGMAGVPVEYFPHSLQEVIRTGLVNHTPWLVSILFVGAAIGYVNLINVWTAWSKMAKAKRARRSIALLAKAERRAHGLTSSGTSPANMKWRKLGPRGDGLQSAPIFKKAGRLRRREITKNILSIVVSVVVVCMLIASYVFINSIFSGIAFDEGRRSFIGIYAAATGKYPEAVAEHQRSERLLKVTGCEFAAKLNGYGAVKLTDELKGAYILHASGNMFLLLTGEGLLLKNFGDGAFELKETAERPRAEFLKDCSDEQ